MYHLGRKIVIYNYEYVKGHETDKFGEIERTTLATFSTNALSVNNMASLIAEEVSSAMFSKENREHNKSRLRFGECFIPIHADSWCFKW